MTSTERAKHARRVATSRRIITVAAIAAATTTTACADNNTQALNVSAVATSPPSDAPTRERLLPRAPKATRRPAPTPTTTHARLGPAIHITIPKVWADLVQCEAHGDWRYGAPGHPGDPGYFEYEGGPNFVHSTWLRYGGGKYAAHAFNATPLQQLVIAKRTLRAEGVSSWPVCGPKVGLSLADAA